MIPPQLRRLLRCTAALIALSLFSVAPGTAGGGGQCGFCDSECPLPRDDIAESGMCKSLCDTFDYQCEGPGTICAPWQVFISCQLPD